MSLDGRTALPNGASQWISGPAARDWVHRLRSGIDAVVVGGGTVRADDPLLTSRGRRSPEPLRVVLSHSLDLPDQAQLWDTAMAPTLVAYGPEADPNRLPSGPEHLLLGVCDPRHLMTALAARGCNQVLWECGPELAAAAIRQGCVQEIAAVVAPKLMGVSRPALPLPIWASALWTRLSVGLGTSQLLWGTTGCCACRSTPRGQMTPDKG
jgi:diaminohydroxyphosphoribosylaminopyrimidine deaminase/5-amino-6-(5-phosphoribosylamino)uracil reductase